MTDWSQLWQGNTNTLQDFQVNSGQVTQAQVDELVKALGTGQAGQAYGNGAYNDMSALRPQSLDGTLKTVTATSEHCVLWKAIDKKPTYNTTQEYNILDRLGGDASPFFVEGGLPNEQDSSYVRKSAFVKFTGVTRVITHPATLMNVAGLPNGIVAQEAANGTDWLIMQIERSLFYGDETVNPLAWNGILKQMEDFLGKPNYAGSLNGLPTGQSAEQWVDMRGGVLSEGCMEDGANIIFENMGIAQVLMTAPAVKKDLGKILPRQVYMPGTVSSLGTGPVDEYKSNAGTFKIQGNIFLRPRGPAKKAADNGAPAAPNTLGITQSAPANDPFSKFSATDGGKYGNATYDSTGTYYYFVSSKNPLGETVAVPISTNAAINALGFGVASGQAISLQWNRVVSAPQATSYVVYRGRKQDGSDALFMAEVRDQGSGTVQTYVDRNFRIPGSYDAFLLNMHPEKGMGFYQLAPLMRVPLARISAADRFMILLYGMPVVFNPRTQVYYYNIGVTDGMVLRDLFDANFRPSYGTIQPVAGTNYN